MGVALGHYVCKVRSRVRTPVAAAIGRTETNTRFAGIVEDLHVEHSEAPDLPARAVGAAQGARNHRFPKEIKEDYFQLPGALHEGERIEFFVKSPRNGSSRLNAFRRWASLHKFGW